MSTTSKTKIIGHPWSFSPLWNEALKSLPERVLVKRDYIYASELGGPAIDRYLKMHAVAPSNPPNERSRRKFIAGHLWEWVAGMILTMIGVLKSRQERVELTLPGYLRVSGKIDFVAGGVIDWDFAESEIKRVKDVFSISIDEMPPFIMHAIQHILPAMKKKFGKNPIIETVTEFKSVSSFMSEKIEKTGMAMPHHVLQTGLYSIAKKMPSKIIYLCKDDTISQEFDIMPDKKLAGFLATDIKMMTDYYNASNHKNPMKTLPPKQPQVHFVEGVWRFEKNFWCEYSNYLKMLYNFDTPEAFRYKWQRTIGDWNRVFKRAVRGDNITPANKLIMKEAVKLFPEWDKYVLKARKAGAFQKIEKEDEE